MPRLLRGVFRKRRELLLDLSQCAAEALAEYMRTRVGPATRPGIVVSIATSGDLLQWHPHGHILVTEPGDFTGVSIAVFDRAQSDLFNLALVPAGVTPREVTDVPVTEAILELVRSGIAVSAMASWVAQPDLEQGRLRAVRIGRKGLCRNWWAVTSALRPTPATVSAFLEILRRTCAARPPTGAGDGPAGRSKGTARRTIGRRRRRGRR